MWRWSWVMICNSYFFIVFSTYVEMILNFSPIMTWFPCILHVCGDDPTNPILFPNSIPYSPRMWRWSWWTCQCWRLELVFSTYVEMILTWFLAAVFCSGILHVCGDDPTYICRVSTRSMYSPRMWRWSSAYRMPLDNIMVFSTYVEMILLDE